MSMDVHSLIRKQRELDALVLFEKKLTIHPSHLYTMRVTAFLVELFEFANELRAFKFWSNKAPSSKEVLLEEYVDALHFLLSMTYTVCDTYTHGRHDIYDDINAILEKPLTMFFFRTGQEVNQIMLFIAGVVGSELDSDSFFWHAPLLKVWENFISLAKLCEFSNEDIEEAYNRKYEINIERQRTGY